MSGASKLYIEDIVDEFCDEYIVPCVQAGAVYEHKYLLGTSMARPLQAKKIVEIAEKEGLAITDYEYKDDLEQFAKDSGYSKVDTFTDKYDKETIVKSMLVKKAQNLVMDSAVITEK